MIFLHAVKKKRSASREEAVVVAKKSRHLPQWQHQQQQQELNPKDGGSALHCSLVLLITVLSQRRPSPDAVCITCVEEARRRIK